MNPNKFQVGLRDILHAQRRLKDVIRLTPLIQSVYHPEVYFKAESLQVMGSFKIRAAFNEISLLSAAQKQRGIVTSSSGNFAQGVAYASKQLDVSAKVVMMKSSNPFKIERTRQCGAEVVFCEDEFEARAQKVKEIQALEKRTTIHPYDHPSVIAGNGTLALEILEQLPEVENIVVPISGGGLISGIAIAAKTRRPKVRIWGVQPQNSNATYLSFQAKKIVSIDRAHTIADGLTVTRPGELTFLIIKALVDGVETVGEQTILRAVYHYLLEERLVVEPSGAVPLAAAFEGKIPLRRTVLVLSGGNISPDLIAQIVVNS